MLPATPVRSDRWEADASTTTRSHPTSDPRVRKLPYYSMDNGDCAEAAFCAVAATVVQCARNAWLNAS